MNGYDVIIMIILGGPSLASRMLTRRENINTRG